MAFGFVEYVVAASFITLALMYTKKQYGEVEYVQSTIDNRSYLVRKLPDKLHAANMIASMNKDLEALVKSLMVTYPDNEDVRRLYQNFNPENVSEGSSHAGYTSYSINKGEKIIMCIRHSDDSMVKKNTVMYVAIHELAHLMTEDVGHTDTFWANFKFILSHAESMGLYSKVDYATKPEEYCGIKITSSVI